MKTQLSARREPAATPGLKSYHLIRIFGFDVRLNLTWLLLALLITWTLAAGLFPADYPGLTRRTYWWMGVAGAVGILLSIVFHELSHSLVARHYGLPVKGITLFIFGGIAEMEEEPASPGVEYLMAIAGPLASILLAIAFFLFWQLAAAQGWQMSVVGVSHYLATLNMILAIFNLVPAFPLDGGRMLRAAIWHWQKDLRRATRIASAIGSGFGLVLMILGVLAFIQGNFIGGMWWLLIGAFLRGAAITSYRQLLIRDMLSDKPVRHFMNADPVTVPAATTVNQLMEGYFCRYYFKLFPVVDNGRLVGCVTVKDIKEVPQEQRAQTTAEDLATPCSPGNTVSPDTPAVKLVSAMIKPDASTRFMVVENNHLLGVISLKDLREFIDLKLELESVRD